MFSSLCTAKYQIEFQIFNKEAVLIQRVPISNDCILSIEFKDFGFIYLTIRNGPFCSVLDNVFYRLSSDVVLSLSLSILLAIKIVQIFFSFDYFTQNSFKHNNKNNKHTLGSVPLGTNICIVCSWLKFKEFRLWWWRFEFPILCRRCCLQFRCQIQTAPIRHLLRQFIRQTHTSPTTRLLKER